MILFCSILTYIIPSGSYSREIKLIEGRDRTVVQSGTYQTVVKHISPVGIFVGEEVEGKATPVSFIQFLSAIPRGMEESADVIFFIFIIGGVLGILQRTGMVAAFIQAL